MRKLKLAIQKKGRLKDESLQLLKECGISIANGGSELIAQARNFPLELLFLRDDDIPQYVEQQVADAGIVGLNEVLEQNRNVTLCEKLGFASCRLSLAIRKDDPYTGPGYFRHRKIATSYPNLLQQYLDQQGIPAIIEPISGSVEIAPSIGLAEAICDLVSTGSTLFTNGLREVETILQSQAVMVSCTKLDDARQRILDQLIFRIRAVNQASRNKYILLNAPDEALESICALLPGIKSPTLLPLAEPGWSSLHSVVPEDTFWERIDLLRQAGAQGILVIPIEKMIV